MILLATASRHFTENNMVGGAIGVLTRFISSHIWTAKQTVEFNIKARVDFKSKKRARMGVWEAMELLNTLVDESDPDVSILLSRAVCHK